MEELHVVSFSGGKDSTAMLLYMLEKGMRVDRIINVDTTSESCAGEVGRVQAVGQGCGLRAMSDKEVEAAFLLSAQNAIEVLGAEAVKEMFRRLVECQKVEKD